MSPQSPSRTNPELARFDAEASQGLTGVLAGVDEAGRGPLAGPVVAAAVIVKNPVFSARIDDSKKLSPARREAAFKEILSKCRVASAMVECGRIDEINTYRATLEAMTQAVAGLGEVPALVLADGPMRPDAPCPVRQVIGGDAVSLSIAAASIVAKVLRDRLMVSYHQRYPNYGFDRHKGYGTAAHLAAIRAHGPCEIHRRSFEPVLTMVAS
ncbi:MAG: ribonuclease HII [Candidatus Omnitrophica bacterium]|nr:ribonuclease HII [Candidatus Omnitrophota bacterium]